MPEERRGEGAGGVGWADALGHGLSWAAGTLLFLFVGTRLDAWLGTRPVLTVVLTLVGAAAGFYSMYRHVIVEPQRKKDAEREERDR